MSSIIRMCMVCGFEMKLPYKGERRMLVELMHEMGLSTTMMKIIRRRHKLGWDDSDLFVPSYFYNRGR